MAIDIVHVPSLYYLMTLPAVASPICESLFSQYEEGFRLWASGMEVLELV